MQFPLRPRTPQESHNAAAVSNQAVQSLTLLCLLLLPLLERHHELPTLEDEVKVQPQEYRHPCLRQLVVPAGAQPTRERADKVQKLVRLVIARGADAQRPQLEIRGRGRKGLEVFEELVV